MSRHTSTQLRLLPNRPDGVSHVLALLIHLNRGRQRCSKYTSLDAPRAASITVTVALAAPLSRSSRSESASGPVPGHRINFLLVAFVGCGERALAAWAGDRPRPRLTGPGQRQRLDTAEAARSPDSAGSTGGSCGPQAEASETTGATAAASPSSILLYQTPKGTRQCHQHESAGFIP